jgi:biopolymer transport protein ExbB
MIEFFIKGGPVMYPLLLCSLISLTVIIERTLFWIRADIHRSLPLVEEVLELFRQEDLEAIRLKSAGSPNRIIRILVTGILHREYDAAKAMEAAAVLEVKKMRRYMTVMDTMITVAPLFGIFGTVLGIISSFEVLGSSGIENPLAVTSGIAEALITTAAGLAIAIVTIFPYNYFNNRIENALTSIETYATQLEIIIDRQRRPPAGQAESGPS